MGASTHAGRVRPLNEDAFLARGHVALVADGMGGHAAGEVASACAVAAFERILSGTPLIPQAVRSALSDANESILAAAAESSTRSGMGTTAAGIALIEYGGDPHWLVFNVGDSRVYRIEERVAGQLTVDHSEVAELIALGKLSEDDARRHPLRHVITRSLGTDPAPEADVWIFPVAVHPDVFVVCSDGLTSELSDDDIASVVADATGPRAAADALVAAAVAAGGRDNVTVVVVTAAPDHEGDVRVETVPRELVTRGQP